MKPAAAGTKPRSTRRISRRPIRTSSALNTRVGLFMIVRSPGRTRPSLFHFRRVVGWIPTSSQRRSASADPVAIDSDEKQAPRWACPGSRKGRAATRPHLVLSGSQLRAAETPHPPDATPRVPTVASGRFRRHAPRLTCVSKREEDAMSVAYKILYWVGFTPWEQMASRSRSVSRFRLLRPRGGRTSAAIRSGTRPRLRQRDMVGQVGSPRVAGHGRGKHPEGPAKGTRAGTRSWRRGAVCRGRRDGASQHRRRLGLSPPAGLRVVPGRTT